jgi:single-stranded-DNA-specific exonuclease
VSNGNVVALRRRLEEIAQDKLGGKDLRKTLTADAEVRLGDMKPGLLKELESLEPTGYGNAEAVFVTREVQVMSARTVGKEANHLKLVVKEGQLTFDCIGFRLGHLAGGGLKPGSKVDLMYTFETNEFRGQTTLQLRLKDVRASEIH